MDIIVELDFSLSVVSVQSYKRQIKPRRSYSFAKVSKYFGDLKALNCSGVSVEVLLYI
jgi:hypothetical protein